VRTMKRGILLSTALALMFAGCNIEIMKERPAESNANLTSIKINGKTASLGTQSSNIADASPGGTVVVAGPVIAVDATAAAPEAAVTWFLTSPDNPDYEPEWGLSGEPEFTVDTGVYLLVIRVTSPDESVIRYYKVKINYTYQEEEEPPPEGEDAQTPVFTVQPIGGTFNQGNDVYLTAEAVVSDGGIVTYEWFSAESPTGPWDSFDEGPEVEVISYQEGLPFYYYVVATNTNPAATGNKTATRESNHVTVEFTSLMDAQKPSFTVHPLSASYDPGAAISLTATASVDDGGAVTYEWFKATGPTGSGASVGSGSPFNPGALPAGAHYFYAVATNTNSAVNGENTATQESERAVITINYVWSGGPGRNPSAVTANNTSILRIDLGASIDLKPYTHFTITLNAYDSSGSTPIAPASWDGVLKMQWERAPDEICAEKNMDPRGPGGSTLTEPYMWRWDLFDLGPTRPANTAAPIPAYLFKVSDGNVSLENSPKPPTLYPPAGQPIDDYGVFTVHPLRYLNFITDENWSAANGAFLEVTAITFYKQ